MGGELGSLVATLLEDESWVGEIEGLDTNPPRRRLKRSTFHLIEPFQHSRTSEIISDFNPHVIIHLGVWEPHARLNTHEAKIHSDELAHAVFDAAKGIPALESFVVRSGVEVYGTHGHWPRLPDEQSGLDPQSTFGHMLVSLEQQASATAMVRGTSIATLRLGTVIGPHVPSPLGRLLRLPAVPYNPFGNPQFSVIGDLDAATAIIAAARHQAHGIANITAEGSISVASAANIGRRFALPVIGPAWWVTRTISGIAGAPVPDHVSELLQHGRGAQCKSSAQLFGFNSRLTTAEVITRLYAWPNIVRIPSEQRVA
jgi:UDP-glucose 4-epimerase